MKEAVGGALLIKLVMFFITIYICFLTVAINYSITFRVKNQIINLIESYEGIENALPKIESYIADIGYYRQTQGNLSFNKPGCQNGYCIDVVHANRGDYYIVSTFVSFSFPIIGPITNLPVIGETKVIYKPTV